LVAGKTDGDKTEGNLSGRGKVNNAEMDSIKGLQCIVNESGERVAAVIDLKEWGDLWEDFFDVLVSESRKDEPTVDWETLKAEIEA
jgi:hypothetical protein